MPSLKSICLVTRDFPRLLDFYRQALRVEPDEADEAYAAFSAGGASLTLYAEAGMQALAPGCMDGAGAGQCVLEFAVADVDEECARLRQMGAVMVKPPTTQPWGVRSVWFRDPDGHLVNFFARVGAARPVDPKAVVREYFQRLLNEKNVAVCDELLAQDYTDDDAPPETPPGPEETKAYVTRLIADYPDLRVEIEDLLAEGSRVAARVAWRGQHRETGQPFDRRGILIFQLNDRGQIARRWSVYREN